MSLDSGEAGNQAFFEKKLVLPSHTSSITWKSNAIKEKEEYERFKQRVRHFAPEQFKPNAKPGRGPSEIFPQNVGEWVTYKKEVLAMAEAEQEKNCELLKAQIDAQQRTPKKQRKIKSAFGKSGKIFKDGLSPILSLPTIWSAEYFRKIASWPSAGEMQWNGDSRQNVLAKTKCGRFLPPPRVATDSSAPFQEQPFLKQLPLDQTGPIFASGPRPDEIEINNADMNDDPDFEAAGYFYLGTALMKEVGEWRPSSIPEWRHALPDLDEMPSQYNLPEEDIGDEVGYLVSQPLDAAQWFDNRLHDSIWEKFPVWW